MRKREKEIDREKAIEIERERANVKLLELPEKEPTQLLPAQIDSYVQTSPPSNPPQNTLDTSSPNLVVGNPKSLMNLNHETLLPSPSPRIPTTVQASQTPNPTTVNRRASYKEIPCLISEKGYSCS